jgi:hypothetical protein
VEAAYLVNRMCETDVYPLSRSSFILKIRVVVSTPLLRVILHTLAAGLNNAIETPRVPSKADLAHAFTSTSVFF